MNNAKSPPTTISLTQTLAERIKDFLRGLDPRAKTSKP